MKAGALFSWLKFLELFLDEFPTSQGNDFPLKSFLGLHDELLCEAQGTKVFFSKMEPDFSSTWDKATSLFHSSCWVIACK